jgi:hypothetical protein
VQPAQKLNLAEVTAIGIGGMVGGGLYLAAAAVEAGLTRLRGQRKVHAVQGHPEAR